MPNESSLVQHDLNSYSNTHSRNLTFPLFNNNPLTIATQDQLLDSQNPFYRQALATITRLQNEVKEKEKVLSERDTELVELRTKYETTSAICDAITSKIPLLASGKGYDAIVFITKPELPALKREDYLNVTIWTANDLEAYETTTGKNETNAMATTKRKKGRPTCAEALEMTPFEWLQGEDGEPAGMHRRTEMYNELCRLCNSLLQRDIAPNSWKNVASTSADFLKRGLSHEFIEFRLGDGRWKVEKYITLKYGQWARGRFPVLHPRKKRRSDDQEPFDLDVDSPDEMEIDSPIPGPAPNGEGGTPLPLPSAPSPRPHAASPIRDGQDGPQTPSNVPLTNSNMQDSSRPPAGFNDQRVPAPAPVLRRDPFAEIATEVDQQANRQPSPAGSTTPTIPTGSSTTPVAPPVSSTTASASVRAGASKTVKPVKEKPRKLCVPNDNMISVAHLSRRRYCDMQTAKGLPAWEDEFDVWYKSPDSEEARKEAEKEHKILDKERKASKKARQAAPPS
ncbi:hypothetical protein V5O48_010666 [Marasmius crinis-equi]|uniref:Uncharacterized protein n=1 Tax=Marasmius crinis-equi TaxID=585013 RepID=A0ABR3F7T2_9AGAR